jgi:carbon monoxide dehydrogenase subunit G
MQLSYTLEVDAPRPQVWTLLRDPQVMAPAIPGFQSLEVLDSETFRVQIAQWVGPFRARVDLEMVLSEIVQDQTLAASEQGTGKSWLKIPYVVVELESNADDGTRLSFSVEFSIAGKLDTLGYPVVKQKADKMARRFGENLKLGLEGERRRALLQNSLAGRVYSIATSR